jgi:hypothetical protein
MSAPEFPGARCETCVLGLPCVAHDPLFPELRDDRPGIPVGELPVVHETPPALPFRRPRRPRSTPTRDALRAELDRLRGLVDSLARRAGV